MQMESLSRVIRRQDAITKSKVSCIYHVLGTADIEKYMGILEASLLVIKERFEFGKEFPSNNITSIRYREAWLKINDKLVGMGFNSPSKVCGVKWKEHASRNEKQKFVPYSSTPTLWKLDSCYE